MTNATQTSTAALSIRFDGEWLTEDYANVGEALTSLMGFIREENVRTTSERTALGESILCGSLFSEPNAYRGAWAIVRVER